MSPAHRMGSALGSAGEWSLPRGCVGEEEEEKDRRRKKRA